MISSTLFISFCVLCYYYLLKCKYNYWNRMGVNGPTPLPIIGNFGKLMLLKQSIDDIAKRNYEQYPNEKLVGLYCGFRKVAVIRDPCIIKQITTKDFKYFVNRGVRTNEEGFCNNLFSCEGDIWKLLRQKLTPAFTKTKLKQMTPLIKECVERLITETENRISICDLCDTKDLSEKYSLDVTSSCIFGLTLDVYSEEIRHFGEISKQISQPSGFLWFWFVAEMIFPGIQCKFVQINPGSHVRSFFMKLVKTVINERTSKGIKRNDMMNIMMELKAQDTFKVNNSLLEIKFDDTIIASQAYAFYVAGQDTSSNVISFLLYELSINQTVQDRLYNEICQVCDKHKGELTYDSLKEMNYLYMVLRETMRKHPAVGFILRQANSNYNIPESKIIIEAGTTLLISITGLHRDAEHFDNPETFNPDNFSKQNIGKIPQYSYLPFGTGQRNCIGYRLAELLILMAVASFLRKFILKPGNNKDHQIRFNNANSITLAPIGGVWVKVSKREKKQIGDEISIRKIFSVQ